MGEPPKYPLAKQGSLSIIEQSLKIVPLPPQEPVTIYPGPNARNLNMSKADLEIADRLAKLRKDEEELPTEEQMAARLAQLKGLPSDHYTKPSIPIYQPPDRRTETEKADDLLKQVMGEIALDAKVPKPEDEIEARLAKLRGSSVSVVSHSQEYREPVNVDLGEGPKPIEVDELSVLLRDTGPEQLEGALASLKSLKKDKELQRAMKKSTKGRPPKGSSSTSEEELVSGSDEEVGRPKEKGETKKEEEEVERIVQLYTQKVRQKEEKRRKRKALKGEKKGSGSDSDSELSSSDLLVSTSESEKISSDSD